MTRMTPLISIAVCVCMITCASCSKIVQIPSSTFEEHDFVEGKTYRLETTTGEVYESKQLTRDEAGFQIVTRTKVGKGRNGRWEESEPIHIPFENVRSLQSIDHQEGRSILLILGAPIALIAVVAVIAVIDFNT